jgi:hypothetical protein
MYAQKKGLAEWPSDCEALSSNPNAAKKKKKKKKDTKLKHPESFVNFQAKSRRAFCPCKM